MAQQKETAVITVKDEKSFKETFPSSYCVLFFWAEWHEPCKQISSVLSELSNDHSKELKFYSIDAEKFESLTTEFNVTAVPTLILMKENNIMEFNRLEAESVPNTVNAIKQFAKHSQTALGLQPIANKNKKNKMNIDNDNNDNNDSESESIIALNNRIKTLIFAAPIMLFMKGSPNEPKCKFSRAMIELLKKENVLEFGYFDILTDAAVRSQLKIYSEWKTYPQLYIEGKLIGGLDIIKEKIEDGEFAELLPINNKLKALINKSKIMLFMKGNPNAPQCGFSNQMCRILAEQGVADYGYFDILSDNEVRQGLKVYSNWPTYPQLYVKGQLIGGLDVVKEMIEDDEFDEAINA